MRPGAAVPAGASSFRFANFFQQNLGPGRLGRRRLRFLQAVDRTDNQKKDEGDDEKIDRDGQKIAPADNGASESTGEVTDLDAGMKVMAPMTGMMMSPTSELTIPPNAAPMITPMARSTTLPRMANSLNSLSIMPSPAIFAAP
jgi:hypothetical protein